MMISAVSSAQEKWILDSENSTITYEASHFLHDWAGTNQNVKGVLIADEDGFEKIAIAMYVRDFDSKNNSRDNNALEILEVLKLPKIEFFSDKIERNEEQFIFSGNFTFHGKEMTKQVDAQATLKPNELVLEGSFDLMLSDFEVPLPSFMMRKMEDRIELKYVLYFHKLDR